MSEPIVPQEVPFEETDEYKARRYAFEREMYEALVDYKHTKLDIEQKFKDDCNQMSREYTKSARGNDPLRIESISADGTVTLNRTPRHSEVPPAVEIGGEGETE